jgi:hypothetical protein
MFGYDPFEIVPAPTDDSPDVHTGHGYEGEGGLGNADDASPGLGRPGGEDGACARVSAQARRDDDEARRGAARRGAARRGRATPPRERPRRTHHQLGEG